MEITLKEIINAVPALNKLADSDLPLPLAYKFSKMTKALQAEIDFFNDERNKVMKKYGGEIRRNCIVFRDAEGNQEFQRVLGLVVSPAVEKFSVPTLEDVRLSAHDVEAREPCVEVEVTG